MASLFLVALLFTASSISFVFVYLVPRAKKRKGGQRDALNSHKFQRLRKRTARDQEQVHEALLLHQLDEEPIAGFLSAVLPRIDFNLWWQQTKNSYPGSMVGSGVLNWPNTRDERVALQILLCRALVAGDIDFLDFTMRYCYPGSNQLSDHVREFARMILIAMLRDITRLSEKSRAAADSRRRNCADA